MNIETEPMPIGKINGSSIRSTVGSPPGACGLKPFFRDSPADKKRA